VKPVLWIQSYGNFVSYSCDITMCDKILKAVTPSCYCLRTGKCPTLLKQLSIEPIHKQLRIDRLIIGTAYLPYFG